MSAYEQLLDEQDHDQFIIQGNMALKWDRFKELPNILKLTTFVSYAKSLPFFHLKS